MRVSRTNVFALALVAISLLAFSTAAGASPPGSQIAMSHHTYQHAAPAFPVAVSQSAVTCAAIPGVIRRHDSLFVPAVASVNTKPICQYWRNTEPPSVMLRE